jgi:hypothetical protein
MGMLLRLGDRQDWRHRHVMSPQCGYRCVIA